MKLVPFATRVRMHSQPMALIAFPTVLMFLSRKNHGMFVNVNG
ncbi:hypothetical protein T08_3598 [Trichinella sp. T8]|nr:hypothetical protein T08_3598 [Trichinella sp. T8]